MEHLATLERLRQSQRQDYLKVNQHLSSINTLQEGKNSKSFFSRPHSTIGIRDPYLDQCKQRIAL